MEKSEMRRRSADGLKAVMNEKNLDPRTLADWWNVEEDTVNKIKSGINLITTDKLYIMYEKVAVSPNRILLGEDYMENIIRQTIDVRNAEFPGHYETAIPEIIIDLSKLIPEKHRDAANRRLTQYFAMRIY